MKPRYRHAPLIDFEAPLPECAKSKPVQTKPVKRQPYDELYLKLKHQRDSWSRN